MCVVLADKVSNCPLEQTGCSPCQGTLEKRALCNMFYPTGKCIPETFTVAVCDLPQPFPMENSR